MTYAPRLLLGVLMTWVLVATAVEALAQPPEIVRLHEDVLAVTVRIDDNCSGQVVYSKRDDESGDVTTYILTAAHCLEGGKQLYRIDIPAVDNANRVVGERMYLAYFVRKDWSADVGLLKLKDRSTWFGRTATLADKDVRVWQGEPVVVAGFPAGLDLTVTAGVLGPTTETRVERGPLQEYYRATPSIFGGNSGGGMYRKGDGDRWELLGISAASVRGTHMSFFVPIGSIVNFLERAAPEVVGGEPRKARTSGRPGLR